MKIRTGFVSNSSSSSFLINIEMISGLHLMMILKHKECVESWKEESEFLGYYLEVDKDPDLECGDFNEWNISLHEDGKLRCSTIMDNFDLLKFCSLIGVPNDAISDIDQDGF